jgi:hypothetical protein
MEKAERQARGKTYDQYLGDIDEIEKALATL